MNCPKCGSSKLAQMSGTDFIVALTSMVINVATRPPLENLATKKSPGLQCADCKTYYTVCPYCDHSNTLAAALALGKIKCVKCSNEYLAK